MQLRVNVDIHYKNLTAIRAVLDEMRDDHIIELERAMGAARLEWKGRNHGQYPAIHVTVPLAWLSDPAQVHQLQGAARALLKAVLEATDGQ